MKQAQRYWLMKSEPDVFSIDDLARMQRSQWEGVRSYQARNHMNAMREGDLALFYHSSTEARGVVGLCRIVKTAYPDPTQFDRKSQYYDAGSKPEQPRWSVVDVEFVEKFPVPVLLQDMKDDRKLAGMLVIKRGMRLSVQPVEAKHMRHVLRRASARSQL